MLSHPTLDQLHALGLHGMVKGFKELDANPEARALEHPEWLALLLEHEITLRRQSASRREHEPRAFASQPPSKMSIIVPPAVSTVLFSASSPPANGSARATTSSSQGPAASAKAGSPAPWDTRPAKRTSLFSIIVSHASSPRSPSRAATDATPN